MENLRTLIYLNFCCNNLCYQSKQPTNFLSFLGQKQLGNSYLLFCVCLLCISSNCKKLSNSNFRRERRNIFYTLFCLSDRKLKKRDKNNLINLMKQCSSIEFVLRTKKLYTDSFPAKENLRQKNYLYCIGNFSTF